MNNETMTLAKIRRKKASEEKIVMVTAYDYSGARMAEAAEVDMILVGDSLGMAVQGHKTTLPVDMDAMVYHTRLVTRGCERPLVVGDMPFLSCAVSTEDALRNAGRLMQEGMAHAVKVEGGREIAPTVKRLVQAGIPVMGHLGFTPQSVHQLGVALQGKTADAAINLLEDALALEESGAFALVLELVPWEVAGVVTQRLKIPTIGIGSGPDCDGQVQVFHDLLGISEESFRHVKRYAEVGQVIRTALTAYAEEVRRGAFPGEAQSRHMSEDEREELHRRLAEGEN